jgi:hypothetical protein
MGLMLLVFLPFLKAWSCCWFLTFNSVFIPFNSGVKDYMSGWCTYMSCKSNIICYFYSIYIHVNVLMLKAKKL